MNGRLQRGVIMVPSTLTLGNLFFGVWAIVAATRGEFETAAWLIVLAALADMMDGRVARVTRTGSRFGEELDSLVDAISFGVAPGFIMYHLFLREGEWGWTAMFIYIAAAVVRLARFNVEQAGHAKVAFHGLPSPSAGIALATFHPFSQTAFFQAYLADWPWPRIMMGVMILLSGLMLSHVLYPVVPKFSFRTTQGVITGVLMLAAAIAALTIPSIFFFPAITLYIAYGMVKAVILGFHERIPERDLMVDEEGDEAGAELREIDYSELARPGRWRPVKRRRRRPRRRRTEGDA